MSDAMSGIHTMAPGQITVESMSEKKEVTVAVQAVGSLDDTFSDRASSQEAPWEPGFWKRFPWLGFAALWVVIFSTVATVVILWSSNERAVTDWCGGRIAPNVFLSIFNNIANLAITLAVGNGIAIAWWRRALKGRTVKELHYSWSFSTSLSQIFLKLRYFNIIALAALATKIAVVDSVLYQKSLDTYIGFSDGRDTTKIFGFAALRLPLSGIMGQTIDEPGDINATGLFYQDLASWNQLGRDVVTSSGAFECEGETCSIEVPGAGFAIDCTNVTETVDWGLSARQAMAQNKSAGYQNLSLSSMNWWLSHADTAGGKNYSSIMLNFTYPTADDSVYPTDDAGALIFPANGSCPGNFTTTTCEFRPAVLNYTVYQINQDSQTRADIKKNKDKSQNRHDAKPPLNAQLINLDTITQLDVSCNWTADQWCGLYDPEWQQLAGIKVNKLIDVVEPFSPGAPSTLQSFYLAFKAAFTSDFSATYNGSSWVATESGAWAYQSEFTSAPYEFCDFTLSIDIEDIINKVNILTWTVISDPANYLGFNEDPNNPVTQTLDKLSEANASLAIYDAFYAELSPSKIFNYTYDLNHPYFGFTKDDVKASDHRSLIVYRDVFYKTSWSYTWGAIAATVVVIACIIPVYYGFWELGRKVTLGPFEIANAFQSPAFAGVQGTAGHADEVMKAYGKNRVQYGEVIDQNGRRYVFQQV